MLWEDEAKKEDYVVPENVLDLAFRIDCKQLPVTHASELYLALRELLPWLDDEPAVGIQQIHGATSGNGWQRPADDALLHLSKRSRMNLRLPSHRLKDIDEIVGKSFEIAGNSIKIGAYAVKPLMPQAVVFARYVAMPHGMEEDEFLRWVLARLQEQEIEVRKMLCGIGHNISTTEGEVSTRSLMIADLDKPSSIALQEQGVGPLRHFGCGIFLPHKGIRAVGSEEDRSHFSGA